jgi:broad specificity phosphatase PhoE
MESLEVPIRLLEQIAIQKIYTSALQRTLSTAEAVSRALTTKPAILLEDRFKERALGSLNSQEIVLTEPLLKNPPPGSGVECRDHFSARVLAAAQEMIGTEGHSLDRILVVSSKGPARVLSEQFHYELAGGERQLYANSQLIKFFVD